MNTRRVPALKERRKIAMTSKKTYLISLAAVLAASVYPAYMGFVMLEAYFRQGGIDVADYPSYIIPYTPICVSLIITTALTPVFYKLFKKFTLLALSVLGALLFLGVEAAFEKITVFSGGSSTDIATWQLFSCVATPQVRDSVWDSLNIKYNPAFKIHFYAISLLIILAVTGVVYGFYKMSAEKNYARKKPLITQLVSVAVFVGLCILACLTAFFRTGNIVISPLSAALMTVFFMTFGITAGVYSGTWLYEKPKALSLVIPSITAALVTVVMYIAEMAMMNGGLFRFGNGFLFEPVGVIPLSPVDIITVLASGAAVYFILRAIRTKSVE